MIDNKVKNKSPINTKKTIYNTPKSWKTIELKTKNTRKVVRITLINLMSNIIIILAVS